MKDYTKYSYEDSVARMTELLKNAEGWGDGYQSSMGQTLIQLMADVTDGLHYMLERRVNESFLDTADLRSSVIARASELGYRYNTVTPNYGEVVFSISEDDEKGTTENIVIPSYTKISFDGDVLYTSDTVIINKGEDSVHVNAIMGEYTELSLDDYRDGAIIRDYDNIVMSTMYIEDANGVVYDDVFKNDDVRKRALSYVDNEPYYDLRYTSNGLRIVFGDGVHGKVPTFPLKVTFLEVVATDPITRTNAEFDLEQRILDEAGDVRLLDVRNYTQIIGYEEAEDTESIRKNAPDYHKTNLRAVTNSDYSFWTKKANIGHIIDAKAYGEEETGGLLFTANNVFITYLTSHGGKLTPLEEQALRNYLDRVKTSQAHIVLSPADVLNVIVDLRVKKNRKNPSANDEIYSILRKYLKDTVAAKGEIGGSVYASEIIHGLYALESFRNDTPHKLIEYAAVDVKAEYPFTYPQRTATTFLSLGGKEFDVGDEWVLHFDGEPCVVTIRQGDTPTTIYERMKKEITNNTNLRANIVLRGLVIEDYGIPSSIEIDNYVGSHRLFGVPSLWTKDKMIDPGSVGSTIVKVLQKAAAVDVEHYYYSSEKGLRPAIPLRNGTDLTFTAPSDTDVNVWAYNDYSDPENKILLEVLQPGNTFEYTSTYEHVIQFEYKDDSSGDAVVYINYSNYITQASYGILVDTYDDIGMFLVEAKSGDLQDVTMVEYNYRVPMLNQNRDVSFRRKPAIYTGSLEIIDDNGEVRYVDDGHGSFVTPTGGIAGGAIDYYTGNIRLPIPMKDGDYNFRFYQDDMESITVDDSTALHFITPKGNYTDDEETKSIIRID